MQEFLPVITAVAAVSAALLALFCVVKLGAGSIANLHTKEGARSETEAVVRAGEEQARVLRQELRESLATFQHANVASFNSLRDGIHGQVQSFGQRLDAGVKAIDEKACSIALKLNDDLSLMRTEANANREGLRQIIERRLDGHLDAQSKAAQELRGELGANFDLLGRGVADSLDRASEHQKERLAATTAGLNQLGEKLEKAQESLKGAVENRLDAIRQDNALKLDEMRQTVDEKLQTTLNERIDQSFSKVSENLERLHREFGELRSLATNVGDLKNVLTNVKVRGAFGEVQLALLLEDLLTPDQFICGAKVKQDSAERVEFAVRMPRPEGDVEVLLPIDAKFPREDYERLQQAAGSGDAKLVAHFQKELEKRIRTCAREIGEKYINPPTTTDWAILFLPTEGLYAEVLRQPGLVESLLRDCRVWIAGPTTLGAILNAFRAVYRSLAIEKRSSEVWRLLGAIRTEFDKYNKVVGQIERQLGTAANTVTSLHQRTRVMTRKLKDVEALPDTAETTKLLELGQLDLDEAEDDEMPQMEETPRKVISLVS